MKECEKIFTQVSGQPEVISIRKLPKTVKTKQSHIRTNTMFLTKIGNWHMSKNGMKRTSLSSDRGKGSGGRDTGGRDQATPLRNPQPAKGGSRGEPMQRVATAVQTNQGRSICKPYNDNRGCKRKCPFGKAHKCDAFKRDGKPCLSTNHCRGARGNRPQGRGLHLRQQRLRLAVEPQRWRA